MPAKGTRKCYYCYTFHSPREHEACRAGWVAERHARVAAMQAQIDKQHEAIDVDFGD